MATISVVVPVYKVEAYLSRCVDSILKQTFADFELILVNDGSPDQCGEMCDAYAEQDARVHVIHQENRGLSAARNAGIDWVFAHSDSQWLTFVDSDDWVQPVYLDALLSGALTCDVDIAIGRYTLTDGEPIPPVEAWTSVRHRTDEYYMNNVVNATVAWGKLYKRECFRDVRFPVGKIHEDEFITYRLLFRCRYVAVIEQPLYAYFQNQEGITKSSWTPARIVKQEGLEGQIAFFEAKGCCQIARARFNSLLSNIERSQALVQESDSLSETEKKAAQEEMRRRLRRVLIKYRKKGWLRVANNERNARIVKSAFPEIRVLWEAWEDVKKKLWRHRKVRKVFKAAERAGRIPGKLKLLLRYVARAAFRRSVLLHSPQNGKLSDQAIAFAELQVLRRLGISCADVPWIEGIEKHCGRLTPKRRLVLNHGGGCLGSLHRNEEVRFRRTLRSFGRNRLIAFQQTIYFDLDSEKGRKCYENSRSTYAAHPGLTLFVRDRYSYDFMRQHMPKVRTELVPDTAMLLQIDLPKVERNGAMICLRRDKEKAITNEERSRLTQLVRADYPQLLICDTALDSDIDADTREAALRDRLVDFASARLVVTDRLDGMIYAAITETPCVVLESRSHKVRDSYEWLSHLDYIRFVERLDELPETIEALKHVTPKYDRAPIEDAMQPLYDAIRAAMR